MELVNRFFACPEQSYYLFGPRGTGKSSWVARLHPGALLIDFLQPDVARLYQGYPERIRETVHGQPDGCTVVVDEVQRVPEVLSAIHALIEEKRGWRFVLTGSSSRKLKKAGVDLMAGRALALEMHPFMARELGSLFSMEKALRLGMLPMVWDAPDPAAVLASYIGIYMREEVQAEGLVRKLDGFARFLEAISFSHAQLLNVSRIAQECEVQRKTVEGFIAVLEDLLLAYRLPVFSKRAKRETVKHTKFYLFDGGVFQSLRPKGPLDRADEIAGAALEGLVGQHLRAWIAYGKRPAKLFFWRTQGGSEVDFVVYGDEFFWALEVKHAQRIHPADLRGLQAFIDDYPEAKPVLLYQGRERRLVKGILCVPCADFLRALTPGVDPFQANTQPAKA
jgi:predicted AAA+ superfamily ATPase